MNEWPGLLRLFFRLRLGVGTIEEKSYDLLEHFPANVHGAVDAIAWLDPIDFANGDVPRHSFAAVAELDVEPRNRSRSWRSKASRAGFYREPSERKRYWEISFKVLYPGGVKFSWPGTRRTSATASTATCESCLAIRTGLLTCISLFVPIPES